MVIGQRHSVVEALKTKCSACKYQIMVTKLGAKPKGKPDACQQSRRPNIHLLHIYT
ncbi:Uncharacterised protein [Vibrio cholerae]|nr:Uncharacterised protein [Vibrio cholerae]CSB75962.1 Uncharacterised protein [Vibrio cholerae]